MKSRTCWVLAFLLAWLIGPSTVSAQEKMTLEQAIDLALKNSQAVEVAAESVTGAEAKVAESKSLYYPQLNVGGNYTRMSLISKFKFPLGDQVFDISFGTPNNYNLRAGVVEQIFNWGRTQKTIEMNRRGQDLARDSVTLTRQAVAYQVVPLFYGVIFFREAIKVLDDNIALYEKKAAIMKERYEAGLASSFDASTLLVQTSILKAQRLDFENNIRKLLIGYNSLAGRPTDAPLDPVAEFAFKPLSADKAELVKGALAMRPEFEQFIHQAQMTQASIGLARTGNKPTVALAASYELRNGFMPNMNRIRGNWNAGIAMTYPVFNGFRENAQVAQGESALRAIEIRRKDLERTVEMEIETSLSDLRTIEQKIDIEILKIRQAEDALRIAEERYQNGLLSATDFIESQNVVESARLNHLQLIYSHILGVHGLNRAVGKRIVE
jgi:outer membrane protein